MNEAALQSLAKLQKRDSALRFRSDEQLGIVRHLRGDLAKAGGRESLGAAGRRFVKANPELFGKIDFRRTEVLEEGDDPQGGEGLTLRQFHGSVPVYDGSIRFHRSADGVLDTVANRLYPDLDGVPKKPRIDAKRAIKATQRATGCKAFDKESTRLVVYRHEGKPRLTWEVRLDDHKVGERGAPARWIAFVDAVSGKALLHYDNVQTAGPVVASGTGLFSGTGGLNAWFDGTTYQLRDTTRTSLLPPGPEIVTNDEDGSSPSSDADGSWNDLTSSPRDQNQGAEVDAHRYAGKVADYYRSVHGRNSFDDAGGNFITLVHYGDSLNNGYWFGDKVVLGDGDNLAPGFNYTCSDDWLAHEFTHAYTEHTCHLSYINESGALNEAISDIFAAFITGDWLVFEDTAVLSSTAPAERNMIDPTNGGQWNPAAPESSVFAGNQPSHYSVRYTGTWDNGGVHVNSGIINNLFYLLTVGGTHTVSHIAVGGIGQSAAERLLFRCMTVTLVGQPGATFLDFREAMLDTCLELFPTDLNKLTQVKNAFNAVGIGPDVYVRDNLADDGKEPYPGAFLYASPDIINRQAPLGNPATQLADLNNDSLWENVEFGQDNYVYVRLQNRGAVSGDATVNVYFSAATTFGTPSAWLHIGSMAAAGVGTGGPTVVGPLTFPKSMIPSPGHFCMIAVVSSSLDPAPDTALISSLSDYLAFVGGSNNIAYRNMDVVDVVPGSPGAAEFVVQTMPGHRERFDLLLDFALLLAVRVVVRAPSWALDGAKARGLRLYSRQGGESIYVLLAGLELERQRNFLGLSGQERALRPGFDGVLVDKEFKLRIDYVLSDEQSLSRVIALGHVRPYISVLQYWRERPVGRAGYYLEAPKPKRRG